MVQAARKIAANGVFQEFGEVVAKDEKGLRVRTSLAEFAAQRAISCLVDPMIGDRVLIASEDAGESFVLAVLSRKEKAATQISADGDLVLRAASGKVQIIAQEGADLVAGAPITVTAPEVSINTLRGKISAQWLEVFGAAVKAELGKVKMVATSFDSVLERFSQRAKRSYRTVEEVDQVRAKQIDWAADGIAQLRGENTLVTATDLVKVNGDQVHLG